MKLCHFGWSNSSHVVRWIQWFAARGYDSHLITDFPNKIEGVTLHVLPSFREYDTRPRRERFKEWSLHDWRLKNIRVLKWTRDRVNEINPDIVHSHILWYPGMLGAFVPSKKYVVTVFNGDVSWRKDRKLFNRLGVRYALRKADIITSVSNNLLEDCKRWGARKTKLHRIMRGLDINRFLPVEDRSRVRRELGLGAGPVVLSQRNIAKLYNLDTILLATPEVVNHFPDVQIVFIGIPESGKEIDSFKELVNRLNVEQNVVIRGTIPYETVHLYNQAADITVSVPSSDGVSSSILEAMACGVVPVASNLPTTREWVEHNKNGLLVTPRDVSGISHAIIAILSDEQKRYEMAHRNAEKIRLEGSEEMWMERMELLYFSLLNGAAN